MDEDMQDAAHAQQQQEEAAQWEAECAKHRQFRRDCDDFERSFKRRLKQIFNSTQTGA
jgi:hypothetical protein